MVGLVTSSFNMGIGPVIPSAGDPLGGGASPDFGAADPQIGRAHV